MLSEARRRRMSQGKLRLRRDMQSGMKLSSSCMVVLWLGKKHTAFANNHLQSNALPDPNWMLRTAEGRRNWLNF